MPSIQECLSELDAYWKLIARNKEDLQSILNSPFSQAQKDELQNDIQRTIEKHESLRFKALQKLLTFPPHHIRHFPKLEEFHQKGSFEKSVFIMTKFPEGNGDKDQELKKVIDSVIDAVKTSGYVPRIASERNFHPGLWDNVEVYLFGCKKGIAIVESRYKEELNPNVMMEWGWMRGMGREVLYLVEKNFNLGRADIGGLLQEYFDWDQPDQDIRNAVQKWLV